MFDSGVDVIVACRDVTRSDGFCVDSDYVDSGPVEILIHSTYNVSSDRHVLLK
jgi:hypothetical protein